MTAAVALASKNNRAELVELLKKHGATPPFAVETALIDQYAGTYKAENNPDLTFRRQNNTLEAASGGQTFALLALSADTFRAEKFEGITLEFLSEGGRVVGAMLRQGKNETTLQKDGGSAMKRLAATLLGCFVAIAAGQAQNWPSFRGPPRFRCCGRPRSAGEVGC